MFFKKTKKRFALQTLNIIDHLKYTLCTIGMEEIGLLIHLKEGKTVEESKEISLSYSAYIVNKLFGDSVDKIVNGKQDFFKELDYWYSTAFGVIINEKYPELKTIIADGIFMYYQAQNILKKTHTLVPLEIVLNQAFNWNMAMKNGKPISRDQFIEVVLSVEKKVDNNY